MSGFAKLRAVVIIAALIIGALLFFITTSSEIILHNSDPLNLSTATIEQIQSNTLVDAKITDTVGAFAYTTKSQEYYYLIPMENGKYIIFVTGDSEQKDKLNTYIDSYDGTLNLDIKGRISYLTTEEQKVFFESVVEANIGVYSITEARQYILPYKIENDNSFTPWINLLLGLLCLGGAVFYILCFVNQRKSEKNFANSHQGQFYTGNEYQGMGYNPYEQNNNNNQADNIGDYYTGYNQSSQINETKNDIHRF